MALPVNCSVMYARRVSHASRRPPDVIIRRSFTRPSTALGDRRPGNEARSNWFGDMSKSEVCRYFIRGRCTYGDRCKYLHPGVGKQRDYSKKSTVRRAMGVWFHSQIASGVYVAPEIIYLLGYVRYIISSLAGQTLTQEERVWSNSHQAFCIAYSAAERLMK